MKFEHPFFTILFFCLFLLGIWRILERKGSRASQLDIEPAAVVSTPAAAVVGVNPEPAQASTTITIQNVLAEVPTKFLGWSFGILFLVLAAFFGWQYVIGPVLKDASQHASAPYVPPQSRAGLPAPAEEVTADTEPADEAPPATCTETPILVNFEAGEKWSFVSVPEHCRVQRGRKKSPFWEMYCEDEDHTPPWDDKPQWTDQKVCTHVWYKRTAASYDSPGTKPDGTMDINATFETIP